MLISSRCLHGRDERTDINIALRRPRNTRHGDKRGRIGSNEVFTKLQGDRNQKGRDEAMDLDLRQAAAQVGERNSSTFNHIGSFPVKIKEGQTFQYPEQDLESQPD